MLREPWRAQARIAAHQRRAGDGGFAKAVAHRIKRRVDALPVVPVNGKFGLDGVAARQSRKRDTDERDAALGDVGAAPASNVCATPSSTSVRSVGAASVRERVAFA